MKKFLVAQRRSQWSVITEGDTVAAFDEPQEAIDAALLLAAADTQDVQETVVLLEVEDQTVEVFNSTSKEGQSDRHNAE